MKINTPPTGNPDRSQAALLSEPHDFNMEAVVGNNFGQGDDHRPSNPMPGSPLAVQLRSALSREQQVFV